MIIDTAGRLAIDEVMMTEVANIKAAVNPQEILFVVDSMTGQDAVNTAKAFNDRLDLAVWCSPNWMVIPGVVPHFDQIHGKQTHQVCQQWRKNGYAGCVLPGKDGTAYPGDGRYHHPG